MSHTEKAGSPVNSPFFRPHAPKGSASGEPKPQESGKDTKLKVGARVECKWEKEGWVGAEVISCGVGPAEPAVKTKIKNWQGRENHEARVIR